MADRTAVAVIIRFVTETASSRHTTYYGPFLPHAGAAVSSMIAELDYNAEQRPHVTYHEAFIEPVFIGDGESDAVIVRRE